jgi:hypothetical protein
MLTTFDLMLTGKESPPEDPNNVIDQARKPDAAGLSSKNKSVAVSVEQ